MEEILAVLGVLLAAYIGWRQIQQGRAAIQRTDEQQRHNSSDYQALARRELKLHRELFPMEFSKLSSSLDDLDTIRGRTPVPLDRSREFRLASGAFGPRQGEFDTYRRKTEEFFVQLQITIDEILAARAAVSNIQDPMALELSRRLIEIGEALETLQTDINIPMQQVYEVLRLVREMTFRLKEIQLSE